MGEIDVMKHGERDSLSVRIANATGLEPAKVGEVVQLALEELHRITIVDEKGLTAVMMESSFEFGAKAAFHLIGLFISDHEYHGRADDAWIWREVFMRFMPTEYHEERDRSASWFAERSAARVNLDADIRDQYKPIPNSERDDEQIKSSTTPALSSNEEKAPQGNLFNVPGERAIDPLAKQYAEEHRQFLERHNPSVLSGQPDQASYLYSVGSQAADRLRHARSSLLNSKEFQKLPHPEQLKQLASCRESTEELIRHDLILQPVPSED